MLTPVQLQTLKTYITSSIDPSVIQWRTPATRDDASLTAWLNASSGDLGWDSRMSGGAIARALIDGAAEVDNLSQGKRDTLFFLAASGQMIDTRLAATRQALLDLTAGSPSNAATVRSSLQAKAKRSLSRFERLYSTGPTAGAYITTLEGAVSIDDVSLVLSSI